MPATHMLPEHGGGVPHPPANTPATQSEDYDVPTGKDWAWWVNGGAVRYARLAARLTGQAATAAAREATRVAKFAAPVWWQQMDSERNGAESLGALDGATEMETPKPGVAPLFVPDPNETLDEFMARLRAPPRIADGEAKYMRFAALVAREVKCKMGLPKRTKANWIVATELVNKVLADRDVRKVDRAHFAPLATQMVFIPTRFDVVARQMALSDTVQARHDEFTGEGRAWRRRWARTLGLGWLMPRSGGEVVEMA